MKYAIIQRVAIWKRIGQTFTCSRFAMDYLVRFQFQAFHVSVKQERGHWGTHLVEKRYGGLTCELTACNHFEFTLVRFILRAALVHSSTPVSF